jgi:hypothetical protein
MLNKGALKFLESISKGRKGNLSIEALKDALTALPGWKVEPIATSYKVTGSNNGDVTDWFSKNHLSGAVLTISDPFGSYIRWKAGTAWNAGPVTPIKVSGTLFKWSRDQPNNPERGIIYSAKMFNTPQLIQDNTLMHLGLDLSKCWIGADGYLITAPNGNSYSQPEKLSRYKFDWNSFTSGSLWTFLYKSGAKEQAEAYLNNADSDAIDRVVRPSTVRSLDNTGTCAVCFRNVKMTTGRSKASIMVDHGYQVPKWYSGRQGNCPGVAQKPFEVSSDGTKFYLDKYLKPSLKLSEKTLKALKSSPDSIQDPTSRKPSMIEKGASNYQRTLEVLIARTESDIRSTKSAIERYDKIVRNWAAKPLPGMSESFSIEMIDNLLRG